MHIIRSTELLLVLFIKLVCGENYHLVRYEQKRLDVPYSSDTTARNAIQCNAQCRMRSDCRSVSYHSVTGQCHYSEICGTDVIGNMVPDQEWDVYAIHYGPDQCGCSYKQASGSFVSPNYPNAYGVSLTCDWTITAPPNKQVVLTFSSMSIEMHSSCDYDNIQVYDGAPESNNLVVNICGSSAPMALRSCKQNTMHVRFKIDSSTDFDGFKATWHFQDSVPCGCTYHNVLTGVITSPNYPNNYTHHHDCVWVLTSHQGQVAFTIIQLEFEVHSECDYDYIEVRSGQQSTSSLISKFCERRSSGFLSSGNALYIRFVTDGSVTAKGFNAVWNMNVSEISRENQTILVQIRPEVLSGPICILIVCQGYYQQLIKYIAGRSMVKGFNFQGGESRGLPDWVHGLYEPVNRHHSKYGGSGKQLYRNQTVAPYSHYL